MKYIYSFLLVIFCFVGYSAEICGKVVKVLDGDTIKVKDDDGGVFKIRLALIDAPQTAKKNSDGQPYGEESYKFLEGKVLGKIVKVKFTVIDIYGRIVGLIYLDKENINELMVKTGNAWHYSYYSKNQNLELLQLNAQKNKLGLWKLEKPEPPWEYRKRIKVK